MTDSNVKESVLLFAELRERILNKTKTQRRSISDEQFLKINEYLDALETFINTTVLDSLVDNANNNPDFSLIEALESLFAFGKDIREKYGNGFEIYLQNKDNGFYNEVKDSLDIFNKKYLSNNVYLFYPRFKLLGETYLPRLIIFHNYYIEYIKEKYNYDAALEYTTKAWIYFSSVAFGDGLSQKDIELLVSFYKLDLTYGHLVGYMVTKILKK